MKRLVLLPVILLGVACGTGASVTDLRCQTPCQSPADPFLLRLEADFADPDAVFSGGQLVVRIDEKDQVTLDLEEILDPGPGVRPGVLRFPLPLQFKSVSEGQTFTVGVRARRGEFETAESSLEFAVHL